MTPELIMFNGTSLHSGVAALTQFLWAQEVRETDTGKVGWKGDH